LIVAKSSEAADGVGVGVQLPSIEELSWTLGVATSSSSTTSLGHAYAVLDFHLRDQAAHDASVESGGAPASSLRAPVRHERVEVTLGQLAVLENSLREALAALEKA
jgi:hypothetical protein